MNYNSKVNKIVCDLQKRIDKVIINIQEHDSKKVDYIVNRVHGKIKSLFDNNIY